MPDLDPEEIARREATTQRMREERQRLLRAYAVAFSTPEGQLVYADLKASALGPHRRVRSYDGGKVDPYATVGKAFAFDMVLQIERNIEAGKLIDPPAPQTHAVSTTREEA